MDTFMEQDTKQNITSTEIQLYYKNHMSPAYKEDEKALKKIIKENVKSTEAN